MAPIQVYVFMDFGCEKGDSEKLTDVCLLAVPRSQFLQPENIEEPRDKIYLDLSSGFDMDIYKKFNDFINQQKKPVCLVAHNGNRFDFQILKRELQKLNVSLSDDLLCADALYAFYDILEEKHKIFDDGTKVLLEFESDSSPSKSNYSDSIKQAMTEQDEFEAGPAAQDTYADLVEEERTYSSTLNVNYLCQTNDVATDVHTDAETSDHKADDKELEAQGYEPNEKENDNMQRQNEKTPEKRRHDGLCKLLVYKTEKYDSNTSNHSNLGNTKRKLFEEKDMLDDELHKKYIYKGKPYRKRFYEGGSNIPKKGEYKLGMIYYRIVRYPDDIEPHPAEIDVYIKFRISHKLGKRFLAWTDQIQHKLADVPAEKITFG